MRLKENLTPHHLKCGIGTCPAVYDATDGMLVIIGKRPDGSLLKDLSGKIAEDEYAIIVSRELLSNISQQTS